MTSLRTRLDPELLHEDCAAGVIHTKGGRPVAMEGMQAHELAVCRLMQRVVLEQALGIIDRRTVVAWGSRSSRTQSSYQLGSRSPR